MENLTEFFARFRQLNVRSNEQLDGWWPRPSGRSGASSRSSSATTPACGSMSLRKCAASRVRWTACWWTGRGAISSAAQVRGEHHANPHRTWRGCPVRLLRGNRPCRTGQPRHFRASQVEPDQQGRWWADMGPVNGPRLGPYDLRSEALVAEAAWLDEMFARHGWDTDSASAAVRLPLDKAGSLPQPDRPKGLAARS